MKQLILAPGSDPYQGTKKSSYSVYNSPHRGESIFSLDPSTLSDHFTTTMVDVPASGSWLLVIAPSGAKSSICINSCFSSLEKKPPSGSIPLGYNHCSKYWSSCPWYWILSSVRFGSFNCLLNDSFQHRYVGIYWQHNFLVNNFYYLLMYQLYCRQENNWIGSSFVDTNIENWNDWYGWQPHIGEETYQITCWRTVFPTDRGRLSVFFRQNVTT